MAGGKIIGGPFSEEVISQLALRSKIISKGSRTNDDLLYITSRTGWVKLTSGVNVGGSSELAKKYIMIGGIKGRTGADTYSNFTGDDGKGFRPMPGITGVQINSVGQFGQLKEATVTFNCWDRSQITELELLFMRPGFTALLEWGHSIYAKTEEEYTKTPQTVGSFFDKGTSKEQLYKEIETLKKKSGYNYDGIFGFIKNFSWSYRQDGGYDCTTNIISIGEIMESLTIDIDTPAVTTTVSTQGETGTVIPATMLQDVLKVLKQSTALEAWTKVKDKFPKFAEKHVLIGGREGLNIATLPLNSVKTGELIDKKAGQKFTYISLKSFCELVNTIIIIDNNNKNLIRLNTDIKPLDSEGGDNSPIPSCRFRTYKFHTSSDPGVCILMTEGSKGWSYEENLIAALQQNHEGSTDEILNIYVNVNLLENAMAGILAKEKGERTLLNLFEPIFLEINDVLGGINELGFHYEESEFTYYIVDRKVQVRKQDVSVLNITGLKSTVTQFNFVTKLSPAITTMCAISAQAGASDVGLEAGALLRWNEGLEDRIITKKSIQSGEPARPVSSSGAPALTPEQERDQQQTDRRKTINTALGQVYNSKQYDSEAIAVARTQYTQYSTNYTQFYAEDTVNVGNAGPAGIIPFQVGIEMDGISGIKIGQAFKINPGIMPSKYDGVVGFLVLGIDHNLAGNRWVTNIKANTIVLKGTTEKPNGPTYSDDFTPTGVAKKEKKGFRSVSNTIKETYIPTLEKVLPAGSKGIKLLITAQTQMEGFAPGTKSYRTNNPGNIGNTDNGGTNKFTTLEQGVKGQYDYAVKVALNQNKNYKLGERRKAPSIYDKDSAQTYPGIDFTYKGTLDQYLKIYSTGARKYDTYLNLVVSYFAKNGHTITGETTLKQIYDIT